MTARDERIRRAKEETAKHAPRGSAETKRAEPEVGVARGEPAAVRPIKRMINITNTPLDEIVAEAWDAETSRPVDRDSLFVRDGLLVRLARRGKLARLRLVEVTQAALLNRLVQIATWVRTTAAQQGENGEVVFATKAAKPPREILGMMIEQPPTNLPELNEVIAVPVFGAKGALVARPGYHAADRLWYDDQGVALESPVPQKPTQQDLVDAIEAIDDLLYDFPFASPSDRTHAFALLLQPFVWRLIDGPMPLNLIEAATPGTGKSLLAKLAGIIVSGIEPAASPWSRDENEVAKAIGAKLIAGHPIVFFDNVRDGIDSETLAAVATSRIFAPRKLGFSEIPELANDATWIITANNPKVSTEAARRFLRLRLVAKTARPHERTGFRHARIETWARDHRQHLIRALLVLVRAWQTAGEPAPTTSSFGSYEGWTDVVGGIIEHAGLPGFLESSRQLYELADADGAEWRQFIVAWHDAKGSAVCTVSELLDLIAHKGLLVSVISDHAAPVAARRSKLGKALRKMVDRLFELADGSEVKLSQVDDKATKAFNWRLVEPS